MMITIIYAGKLKIICGYYFTDKMEMPYKYYINKVEKNLSMSRNLQEDTIVIRQSFSWLVLILIPGMIMPLPLYAPDADEIARLIQPFQALKAQNEAAAARLSALELQQTIGTAPTPEADSDQTDGTAAQEPLARRGAELGAAKADQEQVMRAVTTKDRPRAACLELEDAKTRQDRTIEILSKDRAVLNGAWSSWRATQQSG